MGHLLDIGFATVPSNGCNILLQPRSMHRLGSYKFFQGSIEIIEASNYRPSRSANSIQLAADSMTDPVANTCYEPHLPSLFEKDY